MVARTNPYGLRVTLDAENAAVNVKVVDKRNENALVEEESFPATDIHQSIRNQVALYGLSKLLQDRSSDVAAGPGKVAAMREIAQQLAEGTWQKERQVGAIIVRPEVEAMARLRSCSVSEIQKALSSYPKDAREKMLSHPKVVELAETIRKEREAASELDLSEFASDAA